MNLSMVDLTIILITYNTHELTFKCIGQIYSPENYNVVVIDNGITGDKKLREVKSTYPKIQWKTKGENLGFGRAVNFAVEDINSEYILLLNSDVITSPSDIMYGLNQIKKKSNVGVLGPKILNEDFTIQKSTYVHIGDHEELYETNLLYDKLVRKRKRQFKAIMGSFLYIKLDAFKKAGGFDPDFFMYCEELDLCDRISKLSYEIVYDSSFSVIHIGEASATSSSNTMKQRLLSRSLLVYKRKGLFHFIYSHIVFLVNILVNSCLMWRLDKDYRKNTWRIYKNYFRTFFQQLFIPFNYKRNLGNENNKPLRVN